MNEMRFNGILGSRDTAAAMGAPGVDGSAVTPSDATTFDPPFRFLRVGGAGNVTITKLNDEDLEIQDVLAGEVIWMAAKKVKAATTATKITAFF